MERLNTWRSCSWSPVLPVHPSIPLVCVAAGGDGKISDFLRDTPPVNEPVPTRPHVSKIPDTMTAADSGCLSDNYWPFVLTINPLSVYLQTLLWTEPHPLRLVWLPAAESAGNQPELQRGYTAKEKGERSPLAFLRWHKAGRCGKPQLLHSLRFENMKVTTAFDLQTWIRLAASEKKWLWKTIFPNYLPIAPYPSFHSFHFTLAIQTLIWKWDED